MHLTVIRLSFRRALSTLWREREWRTSSGSLLGICTLFQFLLLGLLVTISMRSLLLSHSDLKLEIRSAIPRGEVQQFLSEILKLPSIERAVYITREQALARLKEEDPSVSAFFENSQMGNPLPDTIGITLKSLGDYPAFSTFLSDARWQSLIDPTLFSTMTRQEERAHELLRVANGGQNLAIMLLLLACAILLFTIIEFTRRSALSHSAEVMVERLVGADNSLLVLPFVWKATLLLWGSIVMSVVVLALFLFFLPTLVPAFGSGGTLAPLFKTAGPIFSFALPVAFVLELLCAPLLAAAGVWLGIRPSLKEVSLGSK